MWVLVKRPKDYEQKIRKGRKMVEDRRGLKAVETQRGIRVNEEIDALRHMATKGWTPDGLPDGAVSRRLRRAHG